MILPFMVIIIEDTLAVDPASQISNDMGAPQTGSLILRPVLPQKFSA